MAENVKPLEQFNFVVVQEPLTGLLRNVESDLLYVVTCSHCSGTIIDKVATGGIFTIGENKFHSLFLGLRSKAVFFDKGSIHHVSLGSTIDKGVGVGPTGTGVDQDLHDDKWGVFGDWVRV